MNNGTKYENNKELQEEVNRLRSENEALSGQLKRLIKVENRLYQYQQELDARLGEYQKLYELNRTFSSNIDMDDIFRHAIGFVINGLEYERAVIFKRSEESGNYELGYLDGYYEPAQQRRVAGVKIAADEPMISLLLQGWRDYLIYSETEQDLPLGGYAKRFLMDDFLIYPIGPFAGTPALLVIGNTARNRKLYRRISGKKGELLGVGNLAGLLSSTMENRIANSQMLKAINQERIAEAKYHGIFEHAVEGIFQLDRDGRLVSANPAMAQLFGYDSPEGLIGSVTDFISERCPDKRQRDVLRRHMLAADRLTNFEVRLARRDGSRLWALLNARIVRDSQGDFVCLDGFVTDITVRKESERELQEAREFLDKIINSIADPIFVKDKQYRWVLLNDACCNLFMRKRKDLLGKTDFELFNQAEASSFRKSDMMVLLSGKEHVNEGEFTDPAGMVHDIITKKALYRDSKGGRFIVGIIRDVTEIRKTGEALRKSEEMLTSVLDNFPGGVFWKDTRLIYLGCNRNFAQGAGLAASAEIVGRSDYDLPWGESEADSYRADDRQVMESRIPKLNIIETQLQADGRTVWFDTSKVPLYDSTGAVFGVLGISSDITERKIAEESLAKAREDLVRQEKLAILGRLSGSVSHELRNPLGIINNAVYLLKLMNPDATDKTREYLDIIKHEIDNSMRIITDLLDFARNKPPRTSSVSVSSLIETGMGKWSFPDSVQVRCDIAEDLPLLRIDPQQIEQVLQNLVINAVQAMPEGGSLHVTAQLVQGSGFQVQGSDVEQRTTNLEPNGDFMEISVSDTGVGIAPEDISRLFQPLFTTKPKGIGLGLVVCKNLVEGNGGRIEVFSEPGKGTCFSLLLPVERDDD